MGRNLSQYLQRRRSLARGLVAPFLTLALIGCDGGEPPPVPESAPRFEGLKLVVGAIGDPKILETVTTQRGEYAQTRGAELSVLSTPLEPNAIEGVDLLLFPADRLGDLIDARVLQRLPESVVRQTPPTSDDPDDPARARKPRDEDGTPEPPADPLGWNEVAQAFRDQISRFGEDRFGLPYGGTTLVLVYRRDALEAESVKNDAQKTQLELDRDRKSIRLPRTWEELDSLARLLHNRDWTGDGQPDLGISVPLGPDPEGVADAIYLSRAASLGQHRDQYAFLMDSGDGSPRVASPPFVEALRDLAAWKTLGPESMKAFDAAAARAAFREGRTALLIDRAEHYAQWTDREKRLPIGVAQLPGSNRVYDPARRTWETLTSINRPSYLAGGGGWLVGIPANLPEHRREAAVDLAKYLIQPQTAGRVLVDRAFPMVPVRVASMGAGLPDPSNAPGVDSRGWGQAVLASLTATKVIPGLRVPQTAAYLGDLALARAQVLAGKSPEDALAEAAASWDKRRNSLGRKKSLWYYQRSLNAIPTSADPPSE